MRAGKEWFKLLTTGCECRLAVTFLSVVTCILGRIVTDLSRCLSFPLRFFILFSP